MLITTQMIRDLIYFNNGPMPLYKLIELTKANSAEQIAHLKTLLSIANASKTINFNSTENIAWVTENQFKSCK